MTKRPSPFETNIYRQSKIHLNNFENDLNALKHVENETLKKLKEGSRKFHSIIFNNELENKGNVIEEKRNLMQKSVAEYFNGKNLQNHNGVQLKAVDVCNKCFYCDKSTNSLDQCLQCLEFYCSTCSFIVYDSFEDKRICLSCS